MHEVACGCMEVHGAHSSRSMGNACIAIHIMFSPAIMHGHAWRAQPPMGGSGDRGVRSEYQVPSKVEGEAGHASHVWGVPT